MWHAQGRLDWHTLGSGLQHQRLGWSKPIQHQQPSSFKWTRDTLKATLLVPEVDETRRECRLFGAHSATRLAATWRCPRPEDTLPAVSNAMTICHAIRDDKHNKTQGRRTERTLNSFPHFASAIESAPRLLLLPKCCIRRLRLLSFPATQSS